MIFRATLTSIDIAIYINCNFCIMRVLVFSKYSMHFSIRRKIYTPNLIPQNCTNRIYNFFFIK